MTIYPTQDSFVKGEVSQKLSGRPTLAFYRTSVSRLVNFNIMPQGGVTKRLGSRFAMPALSHHFETQLFPFIPGSVVESSPYVVEVNRNHFRVIQDGAVVSLDGTNDFAAHGFSNVEYVKSAQSNDVMWLAGGGAKHTLKRHGLNDWRLEKLEFLDGPFDRQNNDLAKKIQADGTTGNVLLTATGITFTSALVGNVIRLEEEGDDDIPTWAADSVIAVGQLVRFGENVYECEVAQNGSASRSPPTHINGSVVSHQIDGAKFKYLHSGYGCVKITSFVSATQIRGDVISCRPYEDVPDAYLPDGVVDDGTRYWSLPMFFDGNEPAAVAFYQERLVFAKNDRVFLSRSGNFNSFREGTNPDDAISIEVTTRQFNSINALTEVNGFLIAVGEGGIQRISSSSGGAIKPDDVFQRMVRRQPMKNLQPLDSNDSIFFFPDPAESVFEASYSDEAGGFLTPDASILSDHLFKIYGEVVDATISRGVVQIGRFLTLSGMVADLTFDKYQQVSGWGRTFLGEPVIATTSVPALGGVDNYFIVSRMVDGSRVRYLEYIRDRNRHVFRSGKVVEPSDPDFGGFDEFGALASTANVAFEDQVPLHLDCAVKYTGGATLSHLEGRDVEWATETRSGSATVSSGDISMPVSEAWVGIPIVASLKTHRLELGRRGDGADAGREQRVSRIIMDVMNSAGIKVMNRDSEHYVLNERDGDFEAGITLKSDLWETPVNGSWSDNGQVEVVCDKPFPATIRSITAGVD